MAKENITAKIREAFNIIGINEIFTVKDLKDVSELERNQVSEWIFIAQKKGLCVKVEGAKPGTYRKLSDDHTEGRNKNNNPSVKRIKTTDLELGMGIIALIDKLRADITQFKMENKELTGMIHQQAKNERKLKDKIISLERGRSIVL